MLRGYNESYTERALELLEKDICYLARSNFGYNMPVEDVRQELRIQLWRKIHLYNPKKKALRTWAQQVMRNRLKDMNRHSTRSFRIPQEIILSFDIEEWVYVSQDNSLDW